MKITRIRIYKTGLPYVGGAYVWGAGNAIEVAQASVVAVDTDAGLQGCGEFTPCGENYIAAHSEGVEALARLVAPELLGEDPRQVARIERMMDGLVQGHGYAKAPFDAACWDILGKACNQPVWMLLGGKLTDGAPMYRVAPQKATDETLAEMQRYRADGYKQFQIKVGGDWAGDIDRIKAGVALLESGERPWPTPIRAGASTMRSVLRAPPGILTSSSSSPARPMRNASRSDAWPSSR